MSAEIPQWAFDRAKEMLLESDPRDEHKGTLGAWIYSCVARYIMQHEEPPVDGDVLAVREILAEANHYAGDDGHNSYMSGANDQDEHFQDALAAYRKHKQ